MITEEELRAVYDKGIAGARDAVMKDEYSSKTNFQQVADAAAALGELHGIARGLLWQLNQRKDTER